MTGTLPSWNTLVASGDVRFCNWFLWMGGIPHCLFRLAVNVEGDTFALLVRPRTRQHIHTCDDSESAPWSIGLAHFPVPKIDIVSALTVVRGSFYG